MKIGKREIGAGHSPYIIAEIGGNHCKSTALAAVAIEAAAKAGADAVKFQSYTMAEVAAPEVKVPRGHDPTIDAYMERLGISYFASLFTGGLPKQWAIDLEHVAEDCGIDFLSTPFSLAMAQFLVECVEVPAIKIASGDLTYTPLLDYLNSRTSLPLILSTGLATMREIQATILGPLSKAYNEGRVALLHCRSVYPCPEEDAGLLAIAALKRNFPRSPIGWSDHTLSVEVVPALAVATGAVIIEKHLRLDVGEALDAGHSLYPWQFQKMVESVRKVSAIMGSEVVNYIPAEAHDRLWARRDPSDWLRPMQPAREGRWE